MADQKEEIQFLDSCATVMNDDKIRPLLNELRLMEIPTELKAHKLNLNGWILGLRNYEDRTEYRRILQNVEQGWTVTEQKLDVAGIRRNYPASIDNIAFGLKKLIERIKKDYILGPFLTPEQFPAEWNNEFATWPNFFKNEDKLKKGEWVIKRRFLTDFSDNSLGVSFNDCLTQEEKTVNYVQVKQICELILACNLKWLWCIDAYEAYYRVPVRKYFVVCPIYYYNIPII